MGGYRETRTGGRREVYVAEAGGSSLRGFAEHDHALDQRGQDRSLAACRSLWPSAHRTMSKYSHYGKRFSGRGRIEPRGALGLSLAWAPPKAANQQFVTNRRMDRWINLAAQPDWKPVSEHQRLASLNVMQRYLERLRDADPDKREIMVKCTWVSIAEAQAAIARLSR